MQDEEQGRQLGDMGSWKWSSAIELEPNPAWHTPPQREGVIPDMPGRRPQWQAQDLELWEFLWELGLCHFAYALESNAVDLTLLQVVTDDELRELGIQALGARKLIKQAVIERQQSHTPVASLTPVAPSPSPGPASHLSHLPEPLAKRGRGGSARW